jgi:hypothetical protein
MVLMTILSGLEGGMPSTCSSIVFTLCSLPSLCLDWFLDADDFYPYCEVSRTVQYLKKALHGTGCVGQGEQQ